MSSKPFAASVRFMKGLRHALRKSGFLLTVTLFLVLFKDLLMMGFRAPLSVL